MRKISIAAIGFASGVLYSILVPGGVLVAMLRVRSRGGVVDPDVSVIQVLWPLFLVFVLPGAVVAMLSSIAQAYSPRNKWHGYLPVLVLICSVFIIIVVMSMTAFKDGTGGPVGAVLILLAATNAILSGVFGLLVARKLRLRRDGSDEEESAR